MKNTVKKKLSRRLAAARLIPPSSERRSILTVIDLFRAVMGWKQPRIEPAARLIPLGSRRRSSKSIVTDLFRAVTGGNDTGLGQGYHLVAGGPHTSLLANRYVLLVPSDPYEVFQDAEWALLIGAKPRGPGMERAGLLDINGQIYAKQLALKAGVFYDKVSNMTIWGNHSTTQRGGVLIQKWGRSSAASTAVSIVDGIRSLVTPTPEGDWFSSGVYSTGNPYGIAEDIVFSMPCRSKGDGDYELAKDVIFDDYLRERIKKLASLCHHLLRLRVMPIVIFLRIPCFLESSNTYEAFKNTYWQESSKVFDYTSQNEPLVILYTSEYMQVLPT
ncbi:hypothetical protein B296_00050039 [Ensete ventricosum]|uniref:Lactate/malate dehydrogenase C-terminal domain-containing protein n=1 Tax=Ensete ventricosum TaxID=4639 RepID=A0A426X7R1_ENSVE|nr:hypothetical protein B296_00050039 [Ensete ventricosum]